MKNNGRKPLAKRMAVSYAAMVVACAALFAACVYISLTNGDNQVGLATVADNMQSETGPEERLDQQPEPSVSSVPTDPGAAAMTPSVTFDPSVAAEPATAPVQDAVEDMIPDAIPGDAVTPTAEDGANVPGKEELAREIWSDGSGLFSESYSRATEEQRAELAKLITTDRYVDLYGGMPVRDIMLIMGDLPKDTPRITLEQAQSVIDKLVAQFASEGGFTEAAILAEFDGIAGAPDSRLGSAFTSYVYFMDDSKRDCLVVLAGGVSHIAVGISYDDFTRTSLYPIYGPDNTPGPSTGPTYGDAPTAAMAQKEELAAEIWGDGSELFLGSYSRATDEQKAELAKLIATDPFVDLYGGMPLRDILLIMGDLAKDTPRVTLEQAKGVIDKLVAQFESDGRITEAAILDEFNGIAGAPDSRQGSVSKSYIYCMDDSKREYLVVQAGGVSHIVVGLSYDNYEETLLYPIYGPDNTPGPSIGPTYDAFGQPVTPAPVHSASPLPQ